MHWFYSRLTEQVLVFAQMFESRGYQHMLSRLGRNGDELPRACLLFHARRHRYSPLLLRYVVLL